MHKKVILDEEASEEHSVSRLVGVPATVRRPDVARSCRIRSRQEIAWAREVRKKVKKEDVVSRNPNVLNGALVFTGTRVPVEVLIQHLAAGDTLEDFLEGFPGVSREQAVAYLEMTPEAVDALIA